MKRTPVIFTLLLFLISGTVSAEVETIKDLSEYYQFWESKKDTSKMVSVLKRGFKLYPEEHYFITNLLAVRLAQHDYNATRGLLKKAVKECPGDPVYWYLFGQYNEAMGSVEEAEMNYLQALAIDKDHLSSTLGIGSIYYHRALNLMKEAKDNGAPDEDALNVAKPTFTLALYYLEKAQLLQNDHPVTLKYLLDIYGKMGETIKYNAIVKLITELQ